MLHIFQGPDLEQLARHMVDRLEGNPPENPLCPEIFVVQNSQMGRWLSLFKAREQGIAANMKIEFPAERIWAIARYRFPDIPKTLPSDRGPLCWAIMHLLHTENHPLLKPLKRYIENDTGHSSLRNWKLSRRIADLFDQYLVYRPGMLIDWEDPSFEAEDEAAAWQAWLWRSLNGRWKQRFGDHPWLHRARLQADLERAMDEGEIDGENLPDRFTVFGVSSMPPPVTRLLVRCSEWCDVTFYQLTPQLSGRHPLAESWGTAGRAYRDTLAEYAGEIRPVSISPAGRADSPASDNRQTSLFSEEDGTPAAGGSMLSHLQHAVATGAPMGGCTADGSIRIHSCHSALREVQVLHDQILDALDRHSDLEPGDILVVTPDMETYAPLIDSVFGVPEEGHPELPWSIGRSPDRGRGFDHLLELMQSRFRATELLDLIDSELFRSAFSLSDEHLNRIERWVSETRIHWGIDGSFRETMGLPASDSNTWESGLDRLLLGYAMQPGGDRLFGGIHPKEGFDQAEDGLLLGTLSAILHRLFRIWDFCRHSHTVLEWRTFLEPQVEFFHGTDERWARERTRVLTALEKMGRESELAEFDHPVGLDIIREWLQEEGKGRDGGSLYGGITFSEMVPVRNIPHRMIAMIGMNDGAFPRSRPVVEFDLMQRYPKAGDRSKREDDRLLMLESVAAAGDLLCLSYVGQSDRQGTRFPPSVAVTELVDCLERECSLPAGSLVTEHRLQAFSRPYFSGSDGEGESEAAALFSYSARQRELAVRMTGDAENPPRFIGRLEPEEADQPVGLSELISFFQHPCRALLQNRLGIYLDRLESRVDDREPFTIDALQRYTIGQELLNRFIGGEDPASYYRVARAENRLPEGWPGEEAFESLVSEVCTFGEELREPLSLSRDEPVTVTLDLDGERIGGKIEGICGGVQVLYRFGSRRAKDLVEMWIRHLAAQTAWQRHPDRFPAGYSGATRLYTMDQDRGVERCELVPVEDPAAILTRLAKEYRSGLCEPRYFFPECSLAYAEHAGKGKPVEEALYRASLKWRNRFGNRLEGDDPYNRQVFPHEEPLHSEAFREQSVAFWKPVLDNLK